jgi:hypothetical protein
MKKPDVSVVMSVYNDAAYLRRAIDGVLTQTGVDLEFIIVDDGSSDESPRILSEYAASDARIRVIRQENAGLTRALINGCNSATGEFIARQDADDVSLPGRLRKQMALLREYPRIGFVSSWADSFTPDGAILDECRNSELPELATERLLNHRIGPPAHGSVMMRTTLYKQVGGYRECFYFGQDSDLWLRLGEKSLMAYVPEVLYRFLRSPLSISGNRSESQHLFGELGQLCRKARANGEAEQPFLEQAEVLALQIRTAKNNGTTLRSANGIGMSYLIGSQLVRKGDNRGRKYLWNVLSARPWHYKAWIRLVQSFVTSHQSVSGPAE